MSMRLAMDDGRDGIEEGERLLAGQRADRPAASAGEVSGPVAMMTLSQSAGGSPAISPSATRDQRMALQASPSRRRRRHRGRPPARRPPAPGGGRPCAMMSEPAAPHLLSAAGRRHSARHHPSGRSWSRRVRRSRRSCARRCRPGAHFVKDDGHAGAGRLPGRFGAGQAGADDVDGFCHGAAGSMMRDRPSNHLPCRL